MPDLHDKSQVHSGREERPNREEASSAAQGRATPVERAFALWCAEQGLIEDADAPHGEAFYAGWQAGRNDGIDTTLVAVRG